MAGYLIGLFAAFLGGAAVGWAWGYIQARAGERERFHEWRAIQIAHQKEALRRNGRSYPAVPGAGPPIKVRKIRLNRE